jgi:hypothetical protein
MRRLESWLMAISLAATVGGSATALAQPEPRDRRDAPNERDRRDAPNERDRRDAPSERDRRRPPPPGAGPTEAPPPPRAEKAETRAGFVWVAGRWDWRGGKWDWVAGHWERERAGKRWNDGRWEKQGDRWNFIAGTWADGGPPPAQPPPAQPPPAQPPPAQPPHGNYPAQPPPPQREERHAPRAGFVWVAGRWDWRDGKWDWVAGHWERERAGKRWNDGRWDKQGDRWTYIEGTWGDGGGPPSSDDRPRHPPPPPRDERPAPRPGHVYLKGRWDWRGGKWDWNEGRWERERPGQEWRESRWEQRDGSYILVDGEWINVGPTGQPPGDPSERPRRWRTDRPTVSSYWPVKGKIGSRITIRGRNFPGDTSVLWGGTQINGARVTPDEITVMVPPGATSGTLSLRTGGRRELLIGNYEVAADYDAAAEEARLAEEARKKAERAWAERQRALAKDRAARQAAYEQYLEERARTREQRRADRLREVRSRWQAAFIADPATQDELTLHAQRTAELNRMREIAELSSNGKLVIRIGVAQSREEERHTARMTALQDSFGRKP